MGNELITEVVIEEELLKGFSEVEELTEEESTDFSEISEMTEHFEEETTKLVKDRELPERGIIDDVTTTNMVIDLALASVAKQTSLKLLKMETFLSKIEDKLFKEETINEMSKGDLIALYTNTRMMRSEAFKMLKEIRKEVDFSSLEANLLSLHSKESLKEEEAGGAKIKSIIESLITDDSFIDIVQKQQKEDMED